MLIANFIIIICLYIIFNIIIIKTMSISEMKEEFIENQTLLKKILANTFYSPAWFYKILEKKGNVIWLYIKLNKPKKRN